jgi:hypothetical protein
VLDGTERRFLKGAIEHVLLFRPAGRAGVAVRLGSNPAVAERVTMIAGALLPAPLPSPLDLALPGDGVFEVLEALPH